MDIRCMVLLLVCSLAVSTRAQDGDFQNTPEYKEQATLTGNFLAKVRSKAVAELSKPTWTFTHSALTARSVAKRLLDDMGCGKGFWFMIFDCETPKYIGLDKQEQDLPSELLEHLKQKFKCDASTQKIWNMEHSSDHPSFFSLRTGQLSQAVPNLDELYKIMNQLGLCEEFMTMLHHPAIYNYPKYKRPFACPKKPSKPSSDLSSSPLAEYAQDPHGLGFHRV